jgi:plastocyanin
MPEEDRFTPFALTIHAGDTVQWVNNDTDDHTVVSARAVCALPICTGRLASRRVDVRRVAIA